MLRITVIEQCPLDFKALSHTWYALQTCSDLTDNMRLHVWDLVVEIIQIRKREFHAIPRLESWKSTLWRLKKHYRLSKDPYRFQIYTYQGKKFPLRIWNSTLSCIESSFGILWNAISQLASKLNSFKNLVPVLEIVQNRSPKIKISDFKAQN